MEAYTFIPGVHILPQEISYGQAEFKNFSIREVFIEGKPKGEYHIRIHLIDSQFKIPVLFFAGKLNECEVGLIDPSNTLNLEYHIYVKTNDPMKIDAMMAIMETLDVEISKNLK